ncbi:MAG: type II secretion system protein [Candidatus Calescibacterium sp.]|nr:type II secretion system GspH family protein [Candidatus Calescibacterium sp.]MDW8194974.1 type II secretion system protein [Candidatus Calescibacterium sp.]
MRKKGFSMIEILVGIAIIALVVGLALMGSTNNKRTILRAEAEKIFKFLKTVQVNATKFAPTVLNPPDNLNSNLFLRPGNFGNVRAANGFFEIATFRLSLVNFNSRNNPAFLQRLNDMNLSEINRSVQITFEGNRTGDLNIFPTNEIPNNPISLVACILSMGNDPVFIGFRTDGRIVLQGGINNSRLRIRISMRGLNRRHFIELPHESIRFEIYSEQNN